MSELMPITMDIAEYLMPLEYMALDCFLALDTIAIGSEAVKTLAATIGMLAARCQLREVRLKPQYGHCISSLYALCIGLPPSCYESDLGVKFQLNSSLARLHFENTEKPCC